MMRQNYWGINGGAVSLLAGENPRVYDNLHVI